MYFCRDYLLCIQLFAHITPMSFTWKEHNSIWKGEGIYFITFTIKGRQKLLGTLSPLSDSSFYPQSTPPSSFSRPYQPSVQRSPNTNRKFTSTLATVNLTPFGFATSSALTALRNHVPGLILCAKQIMPDHLHAVVWITKDSGRSIRQICNGFRIGIKRQAIELNIWRQEDGHILDIPYIRTLSHKGQLSRMIDYTHANPDNAWLRHLHPDLYTIRRNMQLAGLTFDAMGKDRLLSYPVRQVIALSRSLTSEQIDQTVSRALRMAEYGAITYTAAINEGEKSVSRAIRENHHPLVIMLLDGFPPEGSDAARYFHPNGIYHKICSEGKLLLLAPHPSNYDNPQLIALTDRELERKAIEKGIHYVPVPHTSKRWRMIAGNMMLRMVAEE